MVVKRFVGMVGNGVSHEVASFATGAFWTVEMWSFDGICEKENPRTPESI